MKREGFSAVKIARLSVLVAGLIFLTRCGGGGVGNTIPLPVVTIAPASASVQTGAPLQFSATIVSQMATTITWSVNNIAGGSSTLGTITASGLYTAPAAVPNPATVTVKATSSAETNPFGAAIVTITTPAANATVSIAPVAASTLAGTSVQFTATVTGAANPGVTWYVNGVAGGNSTVGSITSSGLYQAPSAVPSPATVVVTATSQADTSQSASTPVMLTASDTAPLFVSFGPNGNTDNAETDVYNGLFTTVTICLPNTPDCQIIPNVLVDTSSVGLRILNSVLTSVPAIDLGTIMDTSGNQVMECVQFPDTSYAWGPALVAGVSIGGETAPSVPIQVIGDTTAEVPAANCLTLGSGPSLDTVEALGANGILGIGTSVQDCGPNCAAGQTFSGYPYYVCPKNVCQTTPLPIVQQVANPVAFFATDNNGEQIQLPSISAAGAPSLPFVNPDGSGFLPAGQLIFGIGTQSNNALANATVYALDSSGNFPQVIYNGVTYNSGGSLDSTAGSLYLSNPATLGVPVCSDNPYYCPSSTTPISLTINGGNGSSSILALNIANADSLFSTNPTFSAFNDLARESTSGLLTDQFDLGLPVFFGRTVFVGIAGTTAASNANAPNGYFAF
jgi:hypothetical protein